MNTFGALIWSFIGLMAISWLRFQFGKWKHAKATKKLSMELLEMRLYTRALEEKLALHTDLATTYQDPGHKVKATHLVAEMERHVSGMHTIIKVLEDKLPEDAKL